VFRSSSRIACLPNMSWVSYPSTSYFHRVKLVLGPDWTWDPFGFVILKFEILKFRFLKMGFQNTIFKNAINIYKNALWALKLNLKIYLLAIDYAI